MRTHRKASLKISLASAAVAALLALAVVVWANLSRPAGSDAAKKAPDDTSFTVVTVHPREDVPDFARRVTQPVVIHGYYRAELKSHVAGPVQRVTKYPGDPVTVGEPLVELDVPDLHDEVMRREQAKKQADQEEQAAEEASKVACAAWQTAASVIEEKKHEAASKATTTGYLQSEYTRFKGMYDRGTLLPGQLAEHEQEYKAAQEVQSCAEAAARSAESAEKEAKSKYEAAKVDIGVKKAMQAVAQAELNKARTMESYTVVTAPFNGFVAERFVDPGTYVQSGGERASPLLTVVRTDLMTAEMWVPEKDAPLVSPETEAVLTLDDLPGWEAHTWVTRPSRYLDPNRGRDMEIQIDLYNPPNPRAAGLGALPPVAAGTDYSAAVASAVGREFAGLGANSQSGAAAVLGAAGRLEAEPPRLLETNMYGNMTLTLQHFEHKPLIPSGAVFSHGDRTYIFKVVNGRAKRVPVRVQYDNGTVAKVVELEPAPAPRPGEPAVIEKELDVSDVIVRANQGAVKDGDAVHAETRDWTDEPVGR